jgi:hypothetical protein
LILLKTFNLKLNTACKNIFFAGASLRAENGLLWNEFNEI